MTTVPPPITVRPRPGAHAHPGIERALLRVSTRVAEVARDCAARGHMAAGLDPRSPRFSHSRRTFRGAVRYELGRQAYRQTGKVPGVRKARRVGRLARRARRNPAAAAAMMIFRYPMSLIKTAIGVVLLILLICWLLWAAVGAPIFGALDKITPSSFTQASCGPQVRPVGGVTGVGWEVGAAAKRLEQLDPDPAAMRKAIFDGVGAAGAAYGWAQKAMGGAAQPTTTVEAAAWSPVSAACSAVCGTGTAPEPVTAAGFDGLAQAVVAAGATGEEAAELLAITMPESQGGTQLVNPTSSARGPWMILLSAHPSVTEAQAMDPAFAARYALKLKRESSRGFAGPWAQTYGEGLHLEHMAAARAAIARAEQGSPGQQVAQAQAVAAQESCAMQVMSTGGQVSAGSFEGRFENGRIPAGQLVPLSASGQQLRADAAASFEELSRAYADYFGTPLAVTDSYRSYEAQVSVRAAKPLLAAVPGTSNHGWGVALDLGGGVQRFGSSQHRWMELNAAAYGWFLPDWAQQDGSKPEPWHWEFLGTQGAVAA